MPINLKTRALATSSTIHVKDAEGVPMYDEHGQPALITVHGPGTRAFGEVEGRQTARAIKRMNDNDGKLIAASTEERRAETAADLAAVTVRFENIDLGPDGPEGAELFEAVYADPDLVYITRQVTKHLGDMGNFKGASPAS